MVRRTGGLGKGSAPGGQAVDPQVQEGLLLAGRVQGIVPLQHRLPGPVEVGNLPAAVGTGEEGSVGSGQEAGTVLGGESPFPEGGFQPPGEHRPQVFPVGPGQVKEDEGVPAGAVDRQQAAPPPQGDDMKVPAEKRALRAPVGNRPFQMPLEGKGEAQLDRKPSFSVLFV